MNCKFYSTFFFLLVTSLILGQELARVRENGKIGYINLQGEYVIQPNLINGHNFSDGYAGATMGDLWGFIDNSGKWVIEPFYKKVKSFKSGRARVLKNNTWNYIDKSGKILETPATDKYYDFQVDDGVAFFRRGNLIGLIDTTGSIILKPKYAKIHRFVNGHARVKGVDKYGMINTKGELVIPLDYDRLGNYHEKGIWGAKSGTYGIIIDGVFKPVDEAKEIWNFTDTSDYTQARGKNKIGFINTKGEWVIEPKFKKAKSFSKGFAPVCNGRKWGLINEEGKMVIPYRYEGFKTYGDNGLAIVKSLRGWGVINLKFEEVVPPTYQITNTVPVGSKDRYYPLNFEFGVIRVKYKKKWGYINEKGEVLGGKWYENANPFFSSNKKP